MTLIARQATVRVAKKEIALSSINPRVMVSKCDWKLKFPRKSKRAGEAIPSSSVSNTCEPKSVAMRQSSTLITKAMTWFWVRAEHTELIAR